MTRPIMSADEWNERRHRLAAPMGFPFRHRNLAQVDSNPDAVGAAPGMEAQELSEEQLGRLASALVCAAR